MTSPSQARTGRSAHRVALFTGAYNHIADGVSRTLNRLVAHLERQEFEVRVFAPTVSDPQVKHAGTLVPVQSISIPGRPDYRLSLGLTPSVRRALDSFQPDLYHIATPDLLGLQALLHARSRRVPVVASYHTHFASYLQYYHLQRLEPMIWRYIRWFYDKCAHVYVPSESMREVLLEHGISEGVKLWERGVDTVHFAPDRRSESWRRQRGFDEDDVVIAFVSRLVWEKGLKRMARVLQSLRERGANFRILIVGDGPARDELAHMLPEAVFTGYLEGGDLATAYASADVFLFPSDTETFGNATLEAMASGVPAVCAEATGSKTLVADGVTGFLVPTSDPECFVDRLQLLTEDADARVTMGRAARESAMHYEWESVLQRIVAYYLQIFAPSDRRNGRRNGAELPNPTEQLTL